MAGRPGDDLTATPERDPQGAVPLANVGRRLRARRTELGWTLAATASAAEVSVSYLSSIEVGNSVPSLPILARIAGSLGLSLNEALRGLGRNALDGGRLDVDRVGVTRTSTAALELEIGTLVAEAGATGPSPVPVTGGELFVYVLEGELEIVLDGETYALRPGDSLDAEAPADVAHRVSGDGRSVSIWATVPGPDARGSR